MISSRSSLNSTITAESNLIRVGVSLGSSIKLSSMSSFNPTEAIDHAHWRPQPRSRSNVIPDIFPGLPNFRNLCHVDAKIKFKISTFRHNFLWPSYCYLASYSTIRIARHLIFRPEGQATRWQRHEAIASMIALTRRTSVGIAGNKHREMIYMKVQYHTSRSNCFEPKFRSRASNFQSLQTWRVL